MIFFARCIRPETIREMLEGGEFWRLFSANGDEIWLSWKSLSSGPEALHANSLCKIITKDSIGILISWILTVGVTKT